MAKRTARQRLEAWAAEEGIPLSYGMVFDHDEGLGWNVSYFLEGHRKEPGLSVDAHAHSIEEACEGVLTGMREYGIAVPEEVH